MRFQEGPPRNMKMPQKGKTGEQTENGRKKDKLPLRRTYEEYLNH